MSTIRPPRSTRRASLRLIACGDIGALSLAAALDDLDGLTDQQWAALDAIAPAATQTVTTFGPLATIDDPWAVDADTAFPVIADPCWWWWLATDATCVALFTTK